jgi:hypothetical protein
VSTVLRSLSRHFAGLLLAGAAVSLAGTALAQSGSQSGGQPQQQPSGGGLVLPGTVQTAPGGSAAGTIDPNARPTPAPGAAPQGQRPPATQQQARPQQPAGPGNAPTAAQAAGNQAAPRPQADAAPASPTGEWQVAPQVYSDGTFRMCVVGNQYDNGLELVFLKSPERLVNLVIAIPNARMQPGARFPAKVSIDSSLSRERPGGVAQPQAIMIPLGDDADLLKGIGSGNVLSVEIPGDTARFRLRGTAKAMDDLDKCVTDAVAGTLPLPPAPPAMPRELAQMLVEAGLQDARALPLDRLPPEQRPGDYAWQIGNEVLGSVRSFPVPATAGDVTAVSDKFVTDLLSKACEGTFTPQMGPAQPLKNFAIRTGTAECKSGEETSVVAMLFQLMPGPEVQTQEGKTERIQALTVFTHEAPVASRKVAEDATGNLSGVLRKLDERAAAQPPAGQTPAPAQGTRQ